MVTKSAKQKKSKGYTLNFEDTKYLIFKSEEYYKKLRNLEIINFCEFSEDNQEKQEEIYSHMLAMEIYLKSLPLIKIKICDDKIDIITQDINDYEDAFEIEFPAIEYYFHTNHFDDQSDFVTFYNTLKSDKVKEKFMDLFKAVGDVLYLQIDN